MAGSFGSADTSTQTPISLAHIKTHKVNDDVSDLMSVLGMMVISFQERHRPNDFQVLTYLRLGQTSIDKLSRCIIPSWPGALPVPCTSFH